MEIWKIQWEFDGCSGGFSYGKTKKEAIAKGEEDGADKILTVEKIKVVVSEKGMIDALNTHASHPDNG